jgi:hypothetical protein
MKRKAFVGATVISKKGGIGLGFRAGALNPIGYF